MGSVSIWDCRALQNSTVLSSAPRWVLFRLHPATFVSDQITRTNWVGLTPSVININFCFVWNAKWYYFTAQIYIIELVVPDFLTLIEQMVILLTDNLVGDTNILEYRSIWRVAVESGAEWTRFPMNSAAVHCSKLCRVGRSRTDISRKTQSELILDLYSDKVQKLTSQWFSKYVSWLFQEVGLGSSLSLGHFSQKLVSSLMERARL